MKRIAWATDIHLDAIDDPTVLPSFIADILSSGAEALLLGGDIANASELMDWLHRLSSDLKLPIYYVLGNHDYYGGDIETVRAMVAAPRHAPLHWLPSTGCVSVATDVALVGHDGWGDARIGDVANAEILTDYLAIKDLNETIDREDLLSGFTRRDGLVNKLGELGDDAAATLAGPLREAASRHRRVVVLTHIPPFREACWHGRVISEETWLPGFTCKAVGDLLLTTTSEYPECHITVLCGHTHGSGYVKLKDNLEVHTGAARYGRLFFRTIDVIGSSLRLSPV